MALKIATASAEDALDALVATVDAGAGTNGTLVIYEGAVPATVDEAIAGQTILIELALPNPSFDTAIPNGLYVESALLPVVDTPASVTGQADFFRIHDTDGNPIIQGIVVESGAGGGDLEISSVNIIAGVNVVVDNFKIRQPKG